MLVGSVATAGAVDALWVRDVKISPQGDRIAFEYQGDIYTVAVGGGEARRLTTHAAYDSTPIWSPDGTQIAFASDRNGNFDVFVMDANGGQAKRLTTNSASEIPETFSPDGKLIYFSAAIQNPTASAMFPTSRMTEFYSVPIEGGKSRQVIGTPVQMPVFTPAGDVMLYQDVKGFEDEWRKHHTSSVTRDIWAYNFTSGKHTNLTNRAGEDRNPAISADGNTVYILSERNGGTFNLWSFPLNNPSAARQLTNFTEHPVRFLSRANNGVMAFTYNGELYTMDSDTAQPTKVNIDVVTDNALKVDKIGLSPNGGVASPDGKLVAFISRGDVFVTSVEYSTTKQVSYTAAAEGDISWGSDNRTLYYTSERSGHKNIYRATMARKDDPNFANATAITEEAMFDVATPEHLTDATDEYSKPQISPDGKKMAFVKNRNCLMVMDLDSKNVRQLTAGETYPGQEDGMTFVWSPDSRWLAIELIPEMRDPYSDIALLNVETAQVTNLTNSGYFCSNPHFALDGNAIIYFTDRYGMRAQASWGSQDDIMIVFLNREARDRFMLSEEDYALLKDSEKADKKDDDKSSDDKSASKKDKKDKKAKKDKNNKKDKDGDDKDGDDKDKIKPITVELDDIDSRIMRLTSYSSSLSDAIVTADGDDLYYLCSFEGGYDLWKLPLRKREPKLVSKLNSHSHVTFQADKEGKNIFLMGGRMQKLDPKSDKLTDISTSGSHEIDYAAEFEAMFNYVTVEEGARFYNKNMHGVDWQAMTENYRRFLPYINNNYDFAEMLSELLGELNVSHTGARYYGGGGYAADRTASLGLLYDMSYTGNGLKVDEIIANGPFDKASTKLTAGAIVTAVNGTELTADTDMAEVFNNIAGKKVLVAFTTAGGEKVEEVIIPVSSGRISSLLYDRWVKQRAADVERWSNGRLGYVHIASMSDENYRPMYADLLGKYNNCEGVVIDIRWNGGGRMHEDIEILFTGEKYLTQEIRGKDVCDMPSRRWNKPSIMLVAEPCYSNAHGTPWVYQHQKIGKVVGAPVPGTMTSVNWVTMQDSSLVFGIPVIGYRTAEGNYLENTQLEPDVKVYNAPESIVTGEDTQLRTAVETLLHDIDAAK
jgi:tricorn protease